MKTKYHDLYACLLLPIIALCVVGQLYLLIPVTSILGQYFQLDNSKISLLSSLLGLGYALGLLLWGPLSDKIGRKQILIGGLGCLALTTLFTAYTDNFNLLLVWRTLQGVFAASFAPISIVWITETLTPQYKLKSLSLISTSFILTSIVAQWYADITITGNLSLAMTILAVLYLLFCGALLPLRQRHTTTSIRLLAIWRQIPHLLIHPNLYTIYLTAFFLINSLVVVYTCFSLYYLETLTQLDLTLSSLRAVALPAMLLPLLSGWLFSKVTPEKVVVGTQITACLMLLLQYFSLHIHASNLLLISHFLFIAAISLCMPTLITLISKNADSAMRGITTSLLPFALFTGASLGAYLPNLLNAQTLFIGFSLILGGLGFINWFTEKQHQKRLALSSLSDNSKPL